MDIPSPSDKCELPKHIPIDMGIAPIKQPYEHHTLHTTDQQQQQQENESSHLSRHSLSPEKLGVVGYVKDVAGFVKDAVHDVKQQRQTKKSIHEKEKEDYHQHHPQDQEQQHPPTSPQPIPNNHPTQHSTPLADAVTSLFPGIGNSPNHASTSPPCTHAEALRENMMEQINYSKEHRLL